MGIPYSGDVELFACDASSPAALITDLVATALAHSWSQDDQTDTNVGTRSIQPSNGNTVTIGTKVYTWQTTLTNVDGNVHIGVDLTASLDNLLRAVTLGSGSGTDYAAAMTANTTTTATASDATTITFERIAGVYTKLSFSGTGFTFDNATLYGGGDLFSGSSSDGMRYRVRIGDEGVSAGVIGGQNGTVFIDPYDWDGTVHHGASGAHGGLATAPGRIIEAIINPLMIATRVNGDVSVRGGAILVATGRLMSTSEAPVSVVGITAGSPTNLNIPAHGKVGTFTIFIVRGNIPGIQGTFTATVVDADNVTIPVDTTGAPSYDTKAFAALPGQTAQALFLWADYIIGNGSYSETPRKHLAMSGSSNNFWGCVNGSSWRASTGTADGSPTYVLPCRASSDGLLPVRLQNGRGLDGECIIGWGPASEGSLFCALLVLYDAALLTFAEDIDIIAPAMPDHDDHTWTVYTSGPSATTLVEGSVIFAIGDA